MRTHDLRFGRSPLALLAPFCALALLLAPGAARGQEPPQGIGLSFQGLVGIGSPKGDLGKTTQDGVLLGFGIGYRVSPRVSLRLDGAYDALKPNGSPLRSTATKNRLGGTYGPRTNLWHYMAGVQFELTPPDRYRWHVSVLAEAGGTYIDEMGSATIAPARSHELTTYGGAQVGYDLSSNLTAFGTAGAYFIFGDRLDPNTFEGKEIVVTNALGLKVRF